MRRGSIEYVHGFYFTLKERVAGIGGISSLFGSIKGLNSPITFNQHIRFRVSESEPGSYERKGTES